VSTQHAMAVHQYVAARNRYRQYSNRTRPVWVAEAYEAAKRRLGKARGEPSCPSPHLQNDPAVCSTCLNSDCYRKATILA
jgi:hypothetical protein